MSSIRTNSAALTALQTLQMTQKSMEMTQNRISTGYKVANASDNAAYWSIATTMRSDSSSLSTVSDALNLGASTIDAAANGLTNAIDVVKQIKDKLVSAATPGVDRAKVQAEMSQLQKQLKGIADSASFNSQNWLSVDSSATGYNATKSIVASFSRDAAGAVMIGTIDVNIANIKLYDANTTAWNTTTNATSKVESGVSGSNGTTFNFDTSTGTLTLTTIEDDATYTGAHMKSTATITGVTTVKASDVGATTRTDNLASGTPGTAFAYNSSAKTLTVTTTSADATNAGKFVTNVTVISNFIPQGAGGILNRVDTGTIGSYTDTAGSTTTWQGTTGAAVTTGAARKGAAISIATMDISSLTDNAADLAQMNAYTKIADAAISSMTNAASVLGSVKSRVTLQQSFVSSLKDSIDKGVGSLVDADMNQESTKLQALQVQSQLGVQSLSIANQAAQQLLKLFQG